ncbi:MAG: glycosyltransferase [Holophagae bacterium]|jgi:glycosyltransferase involved in cell wall biosynthesis
MKPIVDNPSNIRSADIIVGIPSFKEADCISLPTDTAARGLEMYFPKAKAVIINVDNNSPDGTRDAFMETPTKVPKIYISTPEGVKGKGNNVRNLFKAAVELNAQAVAMVDADLKSITPQWIQYLVEPLMGRFDYVTPIYLRHKYDGTITNHIAYPMIRTLGGLRVRQPIGGDFGFSGRAARAFLAEKLWNDKISNFGIDIWMTTIAVARRFNVCQAFLGTPKIHRPKDPAGDLAPMFKQVVSTLFDLMIDFEYLWKYVGRSRPSSIYGFGQGMDQQPPPVNVSTDKLFAGFRKGWDDYGDLWKQILPTPDFHEVERLTQVEDERAFSYSSSLWARIIFDFAVAYKSASEDDRDRIMEALIPFYNSRVLTFVNKTRDYDMRESEEYLDAIQRVFEDEKYYLIERWDQAKSANGRLFE